MYAVICQDASRTWAWILQGYKRVVVKFFAKSWWNFSVITLFLSDKENNFGSFLNEYFLFLPMFAIHVKNSTSTQKDMHLGQKCQNEK